MKELSEYEWAVLGEIACALLRNAVEYRLPNGSYWETSDTLVQSEMELLKKIAQ